MIGAHVNFDVDSITDTRVYLGVRILLNGTTVIAMHKGYYRPDEDSAISIATFYSLAVADYVEAQVWTDEDLDVLATSAYSPEFWACWQRRA